MKDDTEVPAQPVDDPLLELVRRMLQAGGRMEEREVRKLAKDIGLAEHLLESMWTDEPKLLEPQGDSRVVTGAGRRRLNNIR